MVERLDPLLAGPWVENEASPLALVLDLDSELIADISPIPEEVDDDSAARPVRENDQPRLALPLTSHAPSTAARRVIPRSALG